MKKLFLIMLVIACFFIPLTTHAMELDTAAEEQYGVAYDEALAELHTGYYITGIKYGEVVDGCFVHTYEEEVAIINRVALANPGKVDVVYEMDLAMAKRLTENTEFTPEMEAAGYYLSEDGLRIMDPNSSTQESSGGIYDDMTPGPTGNAIEGPSGTLTIIVKVSSEIKNNEYPIRVTLGNTENQSFVFTVNSYNDYIYMDRVPASLYTVMDAGVPGDNTSQYPITYVDESMAEVKNGGAGVIEIGIAYITNEMNQELLESLENSEYTLQDYKQEASLQAAEDAARQAEEDAKTERRNILKAFMPLIIGLGVVVFVIIVIIVLIVKKIKDNNRLR